LHIYEFITQNMCFKTIIFREFKWVTTYKNKVVHYSNYIYKVYYRLIVIIYYVRPIDYYLYIDTCQNSWHKHYYISALTIWITFNKHLTTHLSKVNRTLQVTILLCVYLLYLSIIDQNILYKFCNTDLARWKEFKIHILKIYYTLFKL